MSTFKAVVQLLTAIISYSSFRKFHFDTDINSCKTNKSNLKGGINKNKTNSIEIINESTAMDIASKKMK